MAEWFLILIVMQNPTTVPMSSEKACVQAAKNYFTNGMSYMNYGACINSRTGKVLKPF